MKRKRILDWKLRLANEVPEESSDITNAAETLDFFDFQSLDMEENALSSDSETEFFDEKDAESVSLSPIAARLKFLIQKGITGRELSSYLKAHQNEYVTEITQFFKSFSIGSFKENKSAVFNPKHVNIEVQLGMLGPSSSNTKQVDIVHQLQLNGAHGTVKTCISHVIHSVILNIMTKDDVHLFTGELKSSNRNLVFPQMYSAKILEMIENGMTINRMAVSSLPDTHEDILFIYRRILVSVFKGARNKTTVVNVPNGTGNV